MSKTALTIGAEGLRARYASDLLRVGEVMAGIASGKGIPGSGSPTVNWHLTNWSMPTRLDSKPMAMVDLHNVVALGVASFPVAGDQDTAISSHVERNPKLMPTPIMFTETHNPKGMLARLEDYKVRRVGGEDAPVEPGSLQSLRSIMKEQFEGFGDNAYVADIVIAFPSPNIENEYRPNYAFVLTGLMGEYCANLVVADRLISDTGWHVPTYGSYELLMDYSDVGNLHWLETKAMIAMDRIELSSFESRDNGDCAVIFLTPVRDPDRIALPPASGEFWIYT